MLLEQRIPVILASGTVEAESQPRRLDPILKDGQPGRIGSAIPHAVQHRDRQLTQRRAHLCPPDQQSHNATHDFTLLEGDRHPEQPD
ncbi:MAG: hypothetical protein CM1200mP2_58800 [Planctomycetaceae bacterium]|nr:MAG: hypothetical protein CM1200mP2_58800 [Planctomycetaceae bacterium]